MWLPVPDIIQWCVEKGKDEWYIIYHRRPLGETAANSRATCIDRMYFDKKRKDKAGAHDFRGSESYHPST